MNGVEILNKIPVYGIAEWALYTLVIILIAVPLVFVIYAIVQVVKNYEHWSYIIYNTFIGIFIGLFIGVLFVVFSEKTEIAYDKNNIESYKYQVVISDEVKFNEFNKKYEIIEQDGSIYTVQEKD